ncbi:MAG: HAD hydrolase family protein [Gammaproteobacteria bacterium]|nr:HAD hydrolase family protein [Gammaproteobacteria bacterium]NND59577.1 HAD hydrolase family protein [Gammaproteobacteria bacterium]
MFTTCFAQVSCEALGLKRFPENLIDRARAVRMLVLDVDGVLTDGLLYYTAEGELMKSFHTQDGYGLRRVMRAGIGIVVISGRASAAVERRLRELEINEFHLGIGDKGPLLQRLIERAGCERHEIAVAADDHPDLPMLQLAGLRLAVANAHPDIIEMADWVTERHGGRGAVRDVCDLLLAAQEPQ